MPAGLNSFIPQVWSAQLLVSLKKALVFAQEGVVNRDYEGEIRAAGSMVKINSIGSINVGNYAKNSTSLALQTLDDNQTQLLIDQAKYFNFAIDDVDKAQQNPKVMAQAMAEAAYALRDLADGYVAGLATEAAAGNVLGGAGGTVLNVGNAYDSLVDLSVVLDENNVPAEGRWVVVPAWVHGLLLKDERFTQAGPLGDSVITNGKVGNAAGFTILTSNNVTKTADPTPVYSVMAGYRGAISYAEQISQVEAYRPESKFADAVKGLHLYGAKVVRPTGISVLKCKKA
jgi:N4-gp56 family major capsid protein